MLFHNYIFIVRYLLLLFTVFNNYYILHSQLKLFKITLYDRLMEVCNVYGCIGGGLNFRKYFTLE